MSDGSLRRFLFCLAVLAGVAGPVVGCSSPIDARTALAPKRDAWGDCLASGADLPSDSARVLIDLPTDTRGIVAPGYAEHHAWFRNSDPVELDGREYVKFGRVHRFHPAGLQARGLDLRRVGEHKGVPLYQVVPGPERPDMVFVPLRPGCLFYPYQVQSDRNMRWHG